MQVSVEQSKHQESVQASQMEFYAVALPLHNVLVSPCKKGEVGINIF
jgi:hypothetical protein